MMLFNTDDDKISVKVRKTLELISFYNVIFENIVFNTDNAKIPVKSIKLSQHITYHKLYFLENTVIQYRRRYNPCQSHKNLTTYHFSQNVSFRKYRYSTQITI